MARKRIHELAKELNLSSKDLIAKAEAIGITNKRSQSSITEDEEGRLDPDFLQLRSEAPVLVKAKEAVLDALSGDRQRAALRGRSPRRRSPAGSAPEGS